MAVGLVLQEETEKRLRSGPKQEHLGNFMQPDLT